MDDVVTPEMVAEGLRVLKEWEDSIEWREEALVTAIYLRMKDAAPPTRRGHAMTDLDDLIARLRAATEGVTPGPWRLDVLPYDQHGSKGTDYHIWSGEDMVMYFEAYNPACFWGEAGWRFIAAARQLVPEAAAALASLRDEVARKDAAIKRALDEAVADDFDEWFAELRAALKHQ